MNGRSKVWSDCAIPMRFEAASGNSIPTLMKSDLGYRYWLGAILCGLWKDDSGITSKYEPTRQGKPSHLDYCEVTFFSKTGLLVMQTQFHERIDKALGGLRRDNSSQVWPTGVSEISRRASKRLLGCDYFRYMIVQGDGLLFVSDAKMNWRAVDPEYVEQHYPPLEEDPPCESEQWFS